LYNSDAVYNIPIFKTNVNDLRTHEGILIMLSTFLDICILMDHQKSELLSLLLTIQVMRIHLLVSVFMVHDIVKIALPCH
jgi:DNA-binding Xre family transcriptional regulator